MYFTSNEEILLKNLAKKYNIEYPALLAIIEVESNGIKYALVNGVNEPIIRYEGHYFDRLCDPSVREKARLAKVSSPKVGEIKNPSKQSDRWALVEKAAKFDRTAAYESCSYGVGQVMGSNWKNLKYRSVTSLVNKARIGLAEQVELMLQFIIFNKLDDELRNLDWSGFARGYNGSGYKKNNYHIKMEKAYKANGGIGNTAKAVKGNLRLGSIGAGVREVQSLLVLAGYSLKVDGDFGTATKDAVKDFQSKNNLTVDGIVGKKTQAALSSLREIAPEGAGQPKATNIPDVKNGAITAIGIPTVLVSAKDELTSLAEKISPIEYFQNLAGYVNIIVGVISLCLICYGGYKAYKGFKNRNYSYTGV